ncbi:hypothetical protein R1sor_021162 [Riccia sorocarpa]|uniref:Small-subunit processome Utp12 domain-containing protein n=1 Tax=Riccia sorocarpa TaxID=122646 RepID=A0ABD3GJY0_9MARC
MPTSTSLVAAGYADGNIRIWDIVKGTCETTLVGHKGATTALRYNKSGSLLASGSKDTDIIVWDVVGEAGLFSLRGHRDQVTDVVFLTKGKRLISSSKDTLVRVWDLDTQSCIQTVVGHRGEIWSIDVNHAETYFVTGSADPEIHIYKVDNEAEEESIPQDENKEKDANLGTTKVKWEVLKSIGNIRRGSNDRVATIRFDASGTLLGSQVAGKVLELFSVADDSEAARRMKRRRKRKKEKAAKASDKSGDAEGKSPEVLMGEKDEIIASDVIHLLQTIRMKHKIRSFCFSPVQAKKGTIGTVAMALHNNSVEVHELQESTATRLHGVELPGHRSDVRVARLSQDSSLLMTASHNAVKIWNPQTSACLRTVETGYGLSGVFAPGNRHAIVGTKAGTLEIVDIGAAERSKVVEAHLGAVWSISPFTDGSGFVSGSADHDVKFWEYEVVQATKQLSIRNTRTLRMAEDVLAVCLSVDAKYLAVSLLDSTIKIFFVDTLKFFLSLYGHKLPALGMDISSDGALLVTGSADKNIKIWGMDFGDCHKSLFAHADSVMAVQFVPNTHYVFSVGKDRGVKYWNADTFELLLTLEAHHAEVWCLAVSSHGDFIVTGSHDRSIRRWDRTSEPFFLEEEKEKRMETMFDAGLDDGGYTPKEDVPEGGAAGVAGRKTQDTISAVDSIIEALELAENETIRIAAYKKEKKNDTKAGQFKPNVMLLGMAPNAFVLKAVSSVRPSDLEQALLMLPFMDALKLMGYLKGWISEGTQVELVCRVAVLLLQIHHQQLASTVAARPTLTSLHSALKEGVQLLKDTIGFNLAAMGHLQRLLTARADMPFKDAAVKVMEIRKKLAKRKGAPVPAKKARGRKKKKVEKAD